MKYICSPDCSLGGFCRRFVTKAKRQHTQFMINHKIDEKIMLMTMVKRVKAKGGLAGVRVRERERELGINLHFLGPSER